MESQTLYENFLSWLAACVAMILAGAVLLLSLHLAFTYIIGWMLMSFSILLLGDHQLLPGTVRLIRSWGASKQIEQASISEPRQFRRPLWRRITQFIVILVLAFGVYWISHRFQQPVIFNSSTTVCHCDCAPCGETQNPKRDAGGTSTDPVLRLSPVLESSIKEYLLRSEKSAAAISWLPSGSVVVILTIIAAILVAILLKKHPKEVAPLGAFGLAAACLKNPDKFVRLGFSLYIPLLTLFVCTTAFLLWLCYLKITRDEVNSKITESEGTLNKAKPKEAEPKDAPLTLVFSAFVLLWALVIVVYKADDKPLKKPETSQITTLPSGDKFVSQAPKLGIVSSFLRNKGNELADPLNSLGELKAALSGFRPHTNDVLLLIGSADCSSSHLTNKMLAKQQAVWVKDQISGLSSIEVQVRTLDQHEYCKSSDSLRSVFPIFVRPNSGGKN